MAFYALLSLGSSPPGGRVDDDDGPPDQLTFFRNPETILLQVELAHELGDFPGAHTPLPLMIRGDYRKI